MLHCLLASDCVLGKLNATHGRNVILLQTSSSTIFIGNENIKHYIITIQLPLRHIFLGPKSLEMFSARKPDLIVYNEYIYLILAALILNIGQMSLSPLVGHFFRAELITSSRYRHECMNLDGTVQAASVLTLQA